MRRARVVFAAMIVVAGMVGVSPSPAAAKGTKKSYCKYIRNHQLEFIRVFGIETSVDQAVEISDKEIVGLMRPAPLALKADFRIFRTLVKAIASHDSGAISAAAPPAGAAAQRIIDYTQDNCGSSLPPVTGTPSPTQQIEL